MCWDANSQGGAWGRKRRVRGMHKVFTANTADDTTTTTTTTT